MDRETIFSPDRRYRYTLWRDLRTDANLFSDDIRRLDQYVQFIGLNPSTADETQDDPTVRRCRGFATFWGFGAICMTNIFAFRATDPRDMKREPSPIGVNNDRWLATIAASAGLVVACWGSHGDWLGRGVIVAATIPNLHCFGKTKGGHPLHPLYLKKTLQPIPL